jgi:hypothetical protein
LSDEKKEQLWEISTEYGLRKDFKSLPLVSCWLGLRNEFPVLAGKAFYCHFRYLFVQENLFFLQLYENQIQK